jgi:hypothetical protein
MSGRSRNSSDIAILLTSRHEAGNARRLAKAAGLSGATIAAGTRCHIMGAINSR